MSAPVPARRRPADAAAEVRTPVAYVHYLRFVPGDEAFPIGILAPAVEDM